MSGMPVVVRYLEWDEKTATPSRRSSRGKGGGGEEKEAMSSLNPRRGRRTIDIDRDTTTALEAWRKR